MENTQTFRGELLSILSIAVSLVTTGNWRDLRIFKKHKI